MRNSFQESGQSGELLILVMHLEASKNRKPLLLWDWSKARGIHRDIEAWRMPELGRGSSPRSSSFPWAPLKPQWEYPGLPVCLPLNLLLVSSIGQTSGRQNKGVPSDAAQRHQPPRPGEGRTGSIILGARKDTDPFLNAAATRKTSIDWPTTLHTLRLSSRIISAGKQLLPTAWAGSLSSGLFQSLCKLLWLSLCVFEWTPRTQGHQELMKIATLTQLNHKKRG